LCVAAPAQRLKLMLSFAVGSLLGDVFCHLLPEVWNYMDRGERLSYCYAPLSSHSLRCLKREFWNFKRRVCSKVRKAISSGIITRLTFCLFSMLGIRLKQLFLIPSPALLHGPDGGSQRSMWSGWSHAHLLTHSLTHKSLVSGLILLHGLLQMTIRLIHALDCGWLQACCSSWL
jgi:hypothetical protein